MGTHELPTSAVAYILRPEQLVLQDDPSFLPEFVLPPPELLTDLDLGFDSNLPRSGGSQSLTPYGSQQLSQSPNATGFGLVLPSSSPNRPGDFRLEGGNDTQGDNVMMDVDNMLQLDEPDFTFGEDGDLIEFTPGQPAPATPANAGGMYMHSDAGASARVRQEHKEGQQGGDQVSLSSIILEVFFRFSTHLARSLPTLGFFLRYEYAYVLNRTVWIYVSNLP